MPYSPPAANAVDFALVAFVPEVLPGIDSGLTVYTPPATNAVNFALVAYGIPTFPSVDFELEPGAPAAPVITDQPDSVSITEGDSTVLSVTATGSVLTYQWYQGASGDTSTPLAGETGTTVSVSPVATTSYWVRVTSNGTDSTDSSTATVTVNAAVVSTGGPGKGGKRRKPIIVEVGGERYLVESPEDAIALIEAKRERIEEKLPAQVAQKPIAEVKKIGNVRVIIGPPQVVQAAQTAQRRIRSAIDMEFVALYERKRAEEDDEEMVMFL